jgi:hypothetical protein
VDAVGALYIGQGPEMCLTSGEILSVLTKACVADRTSESDVGGIEI